MQVYFLPEKVEVKPTLEQLPPAFTTALAGAIEERLSKSNEMVSVKSFFMMQI